MANKIEESKKVKAGKKPFYKRWWFKAFAVIVLLGAITGNGEDTATEQDAAHATEATEVATEAAQETEAVQETEATEAATTATTASVDIDDATTLVKSVVEDRFQHYDVYNDGENITINVWHDGVALGAAMAVAGDAECKEVWNGLVDGVVRMCNSAHDLVLTCGLDGAMVTINVVNDTNNELTLLSVTDGVVMYDSVNMS